MKYNHCQNCQQGLGGKSGLKFGAKPKLCDQCEADKFGIF